MSLEREEAQFVFDRAAIESAIEAADLIEKQVRIFLEAYEKLRKKRE